MLSLICSLNVLDRSLVPDWMNKVSKLRDEPLRFD
jgi:hypothetical protein